MSAPLFDPLFAGLTQVLNLRQQQHALTATNLANADTPGFKAKVADFRDALFSAVNRSEAPTLRTTRAGHVGGANNTIIPPILELEPTPWAVDGNSVLPEREMARLQENALMYRAVSTGLSRRLALLKFAAMDGR
jgi:flagellar basal-body rod protein FlgB